MQITQKDFFKDNVRDGNYCGIVKDVEDPLKLGRVRIEVFGFFEGLDPTLLPWAIPASNITGGSVSGGGFYSVPKVDSLVNVKFDNGNIYCPIYTFIQRISNELKDEISASYTNAHSLIYDTTTDGFLKVYFTEEKGLMIDYKKSQINVKPDKSIVVQNASGDGVFEMLDDGTMNITQANDINIKCETSINIESTSDINIKTDANLNIESSQKTNIKCSDLIIDHASSIELGAGASEKIVLGDTFKSFFNSHTHLGNKGIPTSPPIMPMSAAQLSKKQVKSL